MRLLQEKELEFRKSVFYGAFTGLYSSAMSELPESYPELQEASMFISWLDINLVLARHKQMNSATS